MPACITELQEETYMQKSITVGQDKFETSQHLLLLLPANPTRATNKQKLQAELI